MVLRKLYPGSIYVEIHPHDARRLGIASGAKVRISSRHGRIVASAFLTGTVQPGQVFLPMHYAETNQLIGAEFDPYSRQPAYKSSAVALSLFAEDSALIN